MDSCENLPTGARTWCLSWPGEGGLAVRLQLRRAQPAAPAETDGPATGKARGAVCLNLVAGIGILSPIPANPYEH
jgi:hypothetical protein